MAKQEIKDLKMNFTGGEISPLLSLRTDLEVLTRSVKKAKNIEISPYGGITRRGGFVPYSKIGNTSAGFTFDLVNIQSFEIDDNTKFFVVLASQKANNGDVKFQSLTFTKYNRNYTVGKYNSGLMEVVDNREDPTFTFSTTNFNVNEVCFAQNGNNLVMTHKDQRPMVFRYDKNIDKIIIEDLEFINIPEFSFFDQYSPETTQDTHTLILKLDNKWISENENGDRVKRRSPVYRNYKIGFDGDVSDEIVFNSLSNYDPNTNLYVPVNKNPTAYLVELNIYNIQDRNIKTKVKMKDRVSGAELDFNIDIDQYYITNSVYNNIEPNDGEKTILLNKLLFEFKKPLYDLFYSTSTIYNDGIIITDILTRIGGTFVYNSESKLTQIGAQFQINNPVVNYGGTNYTLPGACFPEVLPSNYDNEVQVQLSLTPTAISKLNNYQFDFNAINHLNLYSAFMKMKHLKEKSNFAFEVLPIESLFDDNNDKNLTELTFSLFGVDALEYPVITGEWVGAKFWQGENSYIRSKKLYNANSFLEPAFSELRGWPAASIFLENRLVLGGSKSLPNMLWASRIGDFFNFGNFDGMDDEAILNVSTNTNAIKYLLGQKSLQVFTDNSEHYNPNALTTKEISLPQQSNEGCATIKPVFIDNATFFLDKNRKALRMFIYNDLEQSYKTTNISIEAAHLIGGKQPVAMAARQTETSNFVYILNKDNSITVLNTIREQEIKSFYTFESGITFKGIVGMDNKLFLAGYYNSSSELILYVYDERVELDNVYCYNKFDGEWLLNGRRSIEELPKPASYLNNKFTIKSYPWRDQLDLSSSGKNFYEVDNYIIANKFNSIFEAENFYNDYVSTGYFPSLNNQTIYDFGYFIFNRYLGLDYEVYVISQDFMVNIGTGEKMSELKRICKANIHCYNTIGWYLTYSKKEYIIDNKRNTTSDTNILGESSLFPAKSNGDKQIMLLGYMKRDGIKLEQKMAFAGGVIQGYTLEIKLEV